MNFFAGGGLFNDSFCKDISFIAGTGAEAITGYFDIHYETFFQNTHCQGCLTWKIFFPRTMCLSALSIYEIENTAQICIES